MEKITLSPSKLNLLNDCTRCFYDQNALNIPRPRGIMPSLPGGMDRTMKKYFSNFRGELPPVINGLVPGVLYQDAAKLKKWQYWKTAPRYVDASLSVEVYGAIDDLLIQPDGSVDPFDFKTKGAMPETDGSEYYQLQMDIYNLLFASNGFKVNNRAFLGYLFPLAVNPAEQPADAMKILPVNFGVCVFELKCSTERAKETIAKACEILRGPRPDPNPECEVCSFVEKRFGVCSKIGV